MENQIPEKPKVNYWMISTLTLAALFFGTLGWYSFSGYKTSQAGSNITPTQRIAAKDLEKGWYWGLENDPKPGTPSDWIFKEADRSSCWHKPQVGC